MNLFYVFDPRILYKRARNLILNVHMYIQYNNMTSNTPLDSDPEQDGMMDLV